uniref:NADH-ubiquinone oxidoreductase chain 4 n=1 Tax=Deltocephalinae sp. EMHAU-2015-Zz052318 TaxID=2038644 RepID=A0A343K621_9HEMI|nr:NADH dehydrogenase subunit 4 [Deltocephalinae sp. EMHAU-2015-Zz052318]
MMMKVLFYMFIMTPLCFKSELFLMNQFFYLMLYFCLLFLDCSGFYAKISYFMGLDFFSQNLIMLGVLISSLMIISMKDCKKMGLYLMINLMLMFFLYIIFSSLSFLYMYMSFEFVLVPLIMLIMGWGYQPERLMAGLYLFFYTLLVSLPMLVLILMMYSSMGSMFFDYMNDGDSLFFMNHFIMVLVFMVKLPMFLVHFWLPKAHVQAPVSGSMILAGLMLKIGGYGLIRIMYFYEYMYISYSFIWFSFSMVGSILVSMICLIQGDIKCMIAYSSISHMGMVIMGLMTMGVWGLMGSYLLMLAHGFCSSGMFYLANLFYLRTASRSFYINKGLLIYIPSSAMFWFMFCAFNMSCPPSLNFVSELMILSSSMSFWFNTFFYFIFISFICACFSYYLYSYTQHGLFSSMYSFSSLNSMEFMCVFMHMIPLVFLPLLVISMF